MSWVVRRPASGLKQNFGSTIGGMQAPVVQADRYLTHRGEWSEDRELAVKFPDEQRAWRAASKTLEGGLLVDEVP